MACIKDLDRLGLLEDFIKMLLILSEINAYPHYSGRDYTDNYYVMGWNYHNSLSFGAPLRLTKTNPL